MSEPFHILDDAPGAWDALVRDDPGATPAHRPELWRMLADALPGGRVAFIAVEDHGTLIGGAGVVIERRAGFRWIHAQPWLLTGAPLAQDGAHPLVDRAVATGFHALMRDLASVGGEWACYRPDGPEPAPEALEIVPGTTSRVETAVVDLSRGLGSARARLGKRLRQYLRNETRLLEFADEPDAVEEVYVLYARQARGWPGYAPLPLELSRRLLVQRGGAHEGREAAPLARLFTLRDQGRLLAATLFLDHPRELFAWWSGISPRARGRHVFPLLLWKAVEWAAMQGRARVNLGGSAGRASLIAFKEALGAEDRAFPVRWLSARHATTAGRTIAALQAWRRRARPRGVTSEAVESREGDA